ncbi:MAG TPA: phage holin family protein [Cellulomonas sp.]
MTKQSSGSHRSGLFSRLTEPLADRTRERIEHVEDKVRASIQSEIDAVTRSVRAKAVEVRPSAFAFAAAALATVFGLALLVVAVVVALAAVLELWLAALIVGLLLIGGAAGAAAWGRSRLPTPVRPEPPAPAVSPDAEELVHPWAD